jgi:hypothetical protein
LRNASPMSRFLPVINSFMMCRLPDLPPLSGAGAGGH